MKLNLNLASFVIAIAFLAISCGKKSGNTGLLVPEDAAVVVHVNNAALSSKLSWDEIKQSNWFKEITKKTTDTLAQQFIADPAVTGIDPKSDFVFFFKKEGRGTYYVVQGSLKDPAKYAEYVKKVSNGAAQNKKGDITSVLVHDKMVLNWNNSHFILIGDMQIPHLTGMKGRRYNDDGEEMVYKISTDSLTYFASKIFSLGSDDKLDQDERFVSLVKDGKDIHLWMNTGSYYKGMMGPMASMMGNISSLLDGNVSASSFNFDNGKITMDSKQYYGKELSNLFSKYKVESVSAALIERIPSQNVIGTLVFNYPPEGIKEFIRLMGVEGMVNSAMAETGYSIDEFIKANKGEVLLAATDLTVTQKIDTAKYGGKTYIDTSSKPDIKILFATAVNDGPSFEKLITIIDDQSKGALSKGPKIEYKVENKWFAAGNSSEQVHQFLAGGSNNKASFADKISGHPIGFYIDLQKIFTAAATGAKGSEAKDGLNAAMQTWQDVTAYGGEFKDKAFEFHAEINMVDKNTNSLKQLNTFIDQMYKAMGSRLDKMREMHEGIDTVSVMIPPPPPVKVED